MEPRDLLDSQYLIAEEKQWDDRVSITVEARYVHYDFLSLLSERSDFMGIRAVEGKLQFDFLKEV